APDPAQVGRPALVWRGGNRRQRLDPRTLAHGPFADLPALELEDALHGVLVHAQQPGYGAVAERRLLLDQLLDRLGQLRPHLRRGLGGPVIHRPPRHAELAGQPRYAQLAHPERFGKEPLNANAGVDRKSTRLNSSHVKISYAVFCLKKKTTTRTSSPIS